MIAYLGDDNKRGRVQDNVLVWTTVENKEARTAQG